MNATNTEERLADLLETSFRALKPDQLGGSILALCREMIERDAKAEDETLAETTHD